MLKRYARLMATRWWAPLAVYGSVLAATFTVIWGFAEPANVPADFTPPDFLRYRVVYHIAFSVLIASHATVLITAVARLRTWSSRVWQADPIEGPDISGTWEFVCVSHGKPFPDGGKEHGGTAEIRLKHKDGLTAVRINGTTKWKRDAAGNKVEADLPPSWETVKGFVTAMDEFEYDYETVEEKTRQFGHSKLKVVFDSERPVRLEGQFYNLPPGPPIYGSVKYLNRENPS